MGVKKMDALHLASAEAASCDWFFTTDRGITKKLHMLGGMRIANPQRIIHRGISDILPMGNPFANLARKSKRLQPRSVKMPSRNSICIVKLEMKGIRQ